jgi:hypothetical protein
VRGRPLRIAHLTTRTRAADGNIAQSSVVVIAVTAWTREVVSEIPQQVFAPAGGNFRVLLHLLDTLAAAKLQAILDLYGSLGGFVDIDILCQAQSSIFRGFDCACLL